MDIALQTVEYLANEDNYLPYSAALSELSYVDDMLERTELYGAFCVICKITSVNCNITSVNYQLTSVNYNITSVNYQLTSVNYNITSVNYKITSVNYMYLFWNA
jgi:hypothetical protein